MRWTLLLERKTENALNQDIARKHLRHIAAVAGRNKGLGFNGKAGRLAEPDMIVENGQERKRYLVRLRVQEDKARTPDVAEERFRHVRAQVEKYARTRGWTIIGEGKGNRTKQGMVGGEVPDDFAPVLDQPRPPFRPLELDQEAIGRYFPDVYDRDAHLRILNDAVQTHVATGGDIRAHTLLYGEPGGAKSSLLERLKQFYDDQVERMVFVDAPTMTKAGLETWLLDRAEAGILPEILVLEEMEKCDKDNLLALGSIMASGYIMRTNARIGRVQHPARFLLLATCNDEVALKEFRRGFIWDRFTNQLPCPLPSEEVMYRILLDKVVQIPGGRQMWAECALDLARKMGVRTPRKIIGFLAGRSRLETGAYQQDQLHIQEAGRQEKESLAGSA